MHNEQLLVDLQAHLTDQTLLYAVLSRPAHKGAAVSKITYRLLAANGGAAFQQTNHYATKVTHANVHPSSLLEGIWPLIGTAFREAVFFTAGADYHVLVGRKPAWTVLKKKPTRTPSVAAHNRLKSYHLQEGGAIPFLVELGIMRTDGSLVPKMAHKFRQINRFVETIADIVPHLPEGRPLRIVDFGCGKSYLTFAIYHYMVNILGREVDIVGLDLKADVVDRCSALARTLGCRGLRFEVGDINAHAADGKIDLVVSLHACDTATDAALEKAVQWQADVILCVPCCQHELYSQVRSAALSPLLKHGILRERLAALATDAARAQLLELAGYRTQVMEFIDLEHTPKNLLIRAVRTGRGKQTDGAALEAYRTFAAALEIVPSLQGRLGF